MPKNPSSDRPTPSESKPPVKPPHWLAKSVAGVMLVSSTAATIYGLYADKRIAILAFIGVLFGLVLLAVVGRATEELSRKGAQAGFWEFLVKALAGFIVVYFMVTMALLLPSLIRFLSAEPQHNENLHPAPLGPSAMAKEVGKHVSDEHQKVDKEKFLALISARRERDLHRICGAVLRESSECLIESRKRT